MKKIFLYAYDRRNLGDDLFVHTITQRYPKTQFYMWSGKENRETFACLPNLKVIDRESRWVHFLRKLRPSLVARYRAWLENRCDAVVYIGGSIFMEYPNWEAICTWWECEAENRPFYVLGANFGPWHTEGYRQKMAEVFKNCRDVCFRDKYSKSLFPDVDTVRCAPDILFAHPMPQVPVKDKQIFVSVIDCAGKDENHGLGAHDDSYVSNMAALLRKYLDEGHTLVLSSFCAEEGDEAGIAKLLRAMECENDPCITVLCYDGTNADAVKHAMAESALIVGTRFHAVILGLAAGRPVLPVVYSDKTLHVLEDMGFAGTVFDLRKNGIWRADIQYEKQMLPTDSLREAAQQHFTKLESH